MASSKHVPTMRNDDRLVARKLLQDNPMHGWDEIWKKRLTFWDVGDVQLALQELLQSGSVDFPRTGRALGYDAVLIAAKLGLETVGLDISPVGLQNARDKLKSIPEDLSSAIGKVTFDEADFFTYSVPDGQNYDVIYDYTFFVAFPPERRNEWGRQISALIKPGGYLITLIFPLGLPLEDYHGPPFHVEPEDYIEPLGQGWEKVYDKIPGIVREGREGTERMVVWRRI
ncbi:hypothetical protein SERLA73DRAFT_70920 [Serpula lacrymans var. lacrymans S7.3]|uniref:Methyltransferase domain-containing protein n=2 Tax=Serpula lacrymans var. lacrymans TaxID=341189 RepID=F8PNM6_SERL3|nr:uncharacterized protein SERLADRAFT_435170 [Serpula lacrymans var. lacrymans S7.9]EGO01753.1 hypothetical protein SERLA73DRAFT_70920 [Serpula lacrymans var. lacrymans S7.3]EGO27390.1 hypothetical protein SERLADRAFT_435170 [Serpula lacrymans var. lacrymans S7.9]